jgi:hypothetical protein
MKRTDYTIYVPSSSTESAARPEARLRVRIDKASWRSAAFETIIRIPGDSDRIRWEAVANHPGEVKMPKW